MDTLLVEMMEQEFHSCCLCFGDLIDPVGLPCLHEFCLECWNRRFKSTSGPNKSTVTCPTCEESFPSPKGGGSKGFPKHFTKNLKETDDLERKGNTMKCSLCDEKAENQCTDRKKSLCQHRLRNHDGCLQNQNANNMQDYQTAGAVADEGRFCKVDGGEKVLCYRETEGSGVCTDYVGLKTCSSEYHCGLEEAALKQKDQLTENAKKHNETRTRFQDAMDDVKKLKNNLRHSSQTANTEIDNLESDYIQKVKQQFEKMREEVKNIEMEKKRKLDDSLEQLEIELGQIESVCDQVSIVEGSNSEYLVIPKYPSLSDTITQLSKPKPPVADPELGYLKFEPLKSELPLFGHVVMGDDGEKWQLRSSFAATGLNILQGIAIDKNGHIAVCSGERGVKSYTKQGEIIGNGYSHPAVDVVTADNRCVIAPAYRNLIQCNDMHGNKISDFPITDVNNTPSGVNSVAADWQGRIIVGQYNNTVSIHNSQGSCVSKFATEFRPFRLAVTPSKKIIASSRQGKNLVLMDFSGGNVRVIQPPTEVKVWAPSYVCCTQEEMYVVNSYPGDPMGVYRYSLEGTCRYLGCVTTDVHGPTGIALSRGGTELYVAERDKCMIKIFTRE